MFVLNITYFSNFILFFSLRPKVLGNLNYSSLVGYHFVDTIMDPTDDKLNLLSSAFVKYLTTLKEYDDYSYVTKRKLLINSETWHSICYFRRLKIKNEFKIINCKKDVVNAINCLEILEQDVKDNKAIMEELKTSIFELINQDLNYRDEPEVRTYTFINI